MSAPRILQEHMLKEVCLALEPHLRLSKVIRAELRRRYHIEVSRPHLSTRMREWDIKAKIEAEARRLTQEVVAESLAKAEIDKLQSQVRTLNAAEAVLVKGLDLLEKALDTIDVADIKTFAILTDRVAALMSAASRVRTEMADIGKGLEVPGDEANPPSGDNVLDFAEMADTFRKDGTKK